MGRGGGGGGCVFMFCSRNFFEILGLALIRSSMSLQIGGTLPPLRATFVRGDCFHSWATLALQPNNGDVDVLLCSQVQKVSHKVNFTRLLHISHNTLCWPPKSLHNLCLWSLLGIREVPREIKDNAYAKFGGGGGGCKQGVLWEMYKWTIRNRLPA